MITSFSLFAYKFLISRLNLPNSRAYLNLKANKTNYLLGLIEIYFLRTFLNLTFRLAVGFKLGLKKVFRVRLSIEIKLYNLLYSYKLQDYYVF